MTSFNEWLSQRDSKVYSEMFDEPVSPSRWDYYFNIQDDGTGTIQVDLTKDGAKELEYLTKTKNLMTGKLETMGSHLVNILTLISKEKDIDLTPLRTKLKQLAPQAEMALDAVLKRFATRVGRKLGNDGNLMFSLSSAQKGLRADPSRIGMYKAGMGEREAEPAKQARLAATRSLGFGS